MLQKKHILEIKNVYTANAFQTDKGFFVGAGSETEPLALLYDLATGHSDQVSNSPGGMMSFMPVPGMIDSYVTIMGLFPPFIGMEAGLYLHQRTSGGWKTEKAMDLPFAHRCEFVSKGSQVYLVAATVSKFKENPPDWSQPGELHLIPIEGNSIPWTSEVINSGITRNHGMLKARMGGVESIFVSGAEGIFSITPGEKEGWKIDPVFEKEVSEMTFIDLDGDGHEELITIEPFHGTTLNIYKRSGTGWELKHSDSLSFGHGLSSGMFEGKPVVAVGNRSDSMALEIFTVSNLYKGLVNRKVIEEDAGPTQTQVFSAGSVDYIMSANQKKHEVALYTGRLN